MADQSDDGESDNEDAHADDDLILLTGQRKRALSRFSGGVGDLKAATHD